MVASQYFCKYCFEDGNDTWMKLEKGIVKNIDGIKLRKREIPEKTPKKSPNYRPPLWSRSNIVASHLADLGSIVIVGYLTMVNRPSPSVDR